jgi:hypothetical protein
MYIHGKTKDPLVESRWFFLTLGNGIVCVVSFFL